MCVQSIAANERSKKEFSEAVFSCVNIRPLMPPMPSYGQGRDHAGPRRVSLIHGFNLTDVGKSLWRTWRVSRGAMHSPLGFPGFH